MRARASADAARSISAKMTPGSSPASASTSPQGETIRLWPKVARPFSCRPPCVAASTKAPVSMARARISTCQWASPVCLVKAAGMAMNSAPSIRERAVELRETEVVADGKAEPAEGKIDNHSLAAWPARGRLAVALPSRQIDVEHMQLVVARGDLAFGIDEVRAVGHAGRVELDGERADMQEDAELASKRAKPRQCRARFFRLCRLQRQLRLELHQRGVLRRLHIDGATCCRRLISRSAASRLASTERPERSCTSAARKRFSGEEVMSRRRPPAPQAPEFRARWQARNRACPGARARPAPHSRPHGARG